MLSNPFFYMVAAVVAVLVWAIGLSSMDIFTPDDVKAWRLLAGLRGYALPQGRLEKLAVRSPITKRLQENLDLNRLLSISNKNQTANGFLWKSFAVGGILCAGTLVLEAFYRSTNGDWILGVGPWIAFVVWIAAMAVMIMDLRGETKKRQESAGRALGDSMMLVAIMTDGRGLQLEDAVRILSHCMDNDSLEAIVENKGWKRLVQDVPKTTIDLYEAIGEAYGISAFSTVAAAAKNTNIGFAERDTYTQLAKTIYQQRLIEARMKSARAKILITLPVAGMLIPLLLLLGAPTFSSIGSSLGGH